MTVHFSAYMGDANSSQALNLDLDMSAVLRVDPPTYLPSAFTDPQIRARRLSLIMPTPTLDSRGRPT
jgi:hypothetical protein